LRVHTTNDSTGDSAASACIRCGDLTQPDNHLCTTPLSLLVRRPQNRTMSPRHRLKNPFTMSKRGSLNERPHNCWQASKTATLHP